MSRATVYLIRHGEKPEPETNGLSPQGLERSQALPGVFGRDSQYNIGYIMAQHPGADGAQARPVETVTPLAQALGLDIDTSVQRDNSAGVAEVVNNYSGEGNILICWEHKQLHSIMKALGVQHAPHYPDTRFDLIYTLLPPYDKIDSLTSEDIHPLDDGHQNP